MIEDKFLVQRKARKNADGSLNNRGEWLALTTLKSLREVVSCLVASHNNQDLTYYKIRVVEQIDLGNQTTIERVIKF